MDIEVGKCKFQLEALTISVVICHYVQTHCQLQALPQSYRQTWPFLQVAYHSVGKTAMLRGSKDIKGEGFNHASRR